MLRVLIIISPTFSTLGLTNVGKPIAVEAPEPDCGSGARNDAEVSRVTEIEHDINQSREGTAGQIWKKPSFNEVVSEFADQSRDTAQNNSEAEKAAKRSEPEARFDKIEYKTEQKKNQAQQGNDDERGQQ
jgi:hypothetical protein